VEADLGDQEEEDQMVLVGEQGGRLEQLHQVWDEMALQEEKL
jgi:hypothetical protein